MKGKFKNKVKEKLLITVLAIIFVFNIIFPTNSYAADIGGILLTPIVDLVCSIGDVMVCLLEQSVKGYTNTDSTGFSVSFNPFMASSKDVFETDMYPEVEVESTEIPEGAIIKKENVDNMEGPLGTYQIPVYIYGPDQIFSNQADLLKINFFDPGEKTDSNSAAILQKTISSWYLSLRNLTIVGLLCVLVYVGIRIIISTTAGDKAKYKQMLMDWVIALCLVFFLHYIMAFTVMITEEISNAISAGTTEIYVHANSPLDDQKGQKPVPEGYFKTNLMGYARFMTQSNTFEEEISYLVMYLALVVYAVIFTWIYLKRLLTLAFLTLIAPIVALTYPIDKISDGKAQAFNAWLREYIYNVLIQPFHLIIYTTLVTSAMDLASTNIIYVIAALGFMLPAEKLLKKFFGFDKADGGTMGSLASGAILGSMAQKAIGAIASGASKGGSKAKAGGDVKLPEGEKQPRFEADKVNLEDVGNENRIDNSGNTTSNPRVYDPNNKSDVLDQKIDNIKNGINGAKGWVNDKVDGAKGWINGKVDGTKQYFNDVGTMAKDNWKDMKKEHMWAAVADKGARGIGKGIKKSARGVRNISGAVGRVNRKYGITKQIPGAMRTVAGTAFKASTGTLAAAVTMASGGGLTGGITAFGLGSTVANKVSGAAFDAIEAAPSKNREFIDTVRGDTKLQDSYAKKQWYKDENNKEEVRKMLKKKNGGYMPSEREVNSYMKELTPYVDQGITDIKQASKAYETAKDYGITDKKSAMIAAIGKERSITKDILNDEKKFNAELNNLRQEFKNKNLDEKQADMIMEVLKAQNGVAHNLKKKK